MARYIFKPLQPNSLQRFCNSLVTGAVLQGRQPGKIFFWGQQALDACRMANPQAMAGQLMTLTAQRNAQIENLACGRCINPANKRSRLVLPLPLGPDTCSICPYSSCNSSPENSTRQSRSHVSPRACKKTSVTQWPFSIKLGTQSANTARYAYHKLRLYTDRGRLTKPVAKKYPSDQESNTRHIAAGCPVSIGYDHCQPLPGSRSSSIPRRHSANRTPSVKPCDLQNSCPAINPSTQTNARQHNYKLPGLAQTKP